MKTKLTSQQVKWASEHDWFIRDNKDGSVTVLEELFEGGVCVSSNTKIFNNFQALRDWAGY